jgi:maleate isomerase
MKDTLGHRMKFGIIIPSTNTTVQPEMDGMRPDGVTNQIGRFPKDNLRFDNDDHFGKIVRVSSTVDETAETLMTCEVNHFIIMNAIVSTTGRKLSVARLSGILIKQRYYVDGTNGAGQRGAELMECTAVVF